MVYKTRIGCTDYETEKKARSNGWQGETLPPNFFLFAFRQIGAGRLPLPMGLLDNSDLTWTLH